MTLQPIFDWIDANADAIVADLQAFVQQPSISAQNVGLRECADLVRRMMHDDGLPAEFQDAAVLLPLRRAATGADRGLDPWGPVVGRGGGRFPLRPRGDR